MLLFLVNILLFIVGMFLDAGPAILILGPVLGPVFVGLGVDPLHFAIIMCVNVTVGLATPPMGLVLFVAASLSGERVERIALEMLPFLAIEAAVIFPDHVRAGDLDDHPAPAGIRVAARRRRVPSRAPVPARASRGRGFIAASARPL